MAYQVVSWVLEHAPRDLRPSEMLVAVVLAEHAAEDGTHAYPSVATVVHEARLSERAVRMAIKELGRRGVLAVELPATNKMPAVYRFPLYRGAECAPPNGRWGANGAPLEVQELHPECVGGAECAPLGVQSTHLGVQFTTSRGAEFAPKPSVEPSLEPSEEPSDGGAGAPKPAPVSHRKKKITTTLPDDWDQAQDWDELYEWAHKELAMLGPQVDRETDKFVDHWRSNAEEKADWLATWRNWMRRSREPARARR